MNVPEPLSRAPLRARLYAALHHGNPGDLEFYLSHCATARRVLELGSGAGRLAIPLAESGVHVTGVELDPGLLALARENVARREASLARELTTSFVAGDMTSFVEPGAFDRVLIPYSAFWCLPDVAAKRECLANAYRSLRADGQLILDVYDADVWMPDEEDGDAASLVGSEGIDVDEFEHVGDLVFEGEQYRVWERDAWDHVRRVMRVEYRVQGFSSGRLSPEGAAADGTSETAAFLGERELAVEHHVLWRHELGELLDECGFDAEWGVDERDEGTAFSEQIVIRAHKS
jgi:SAM-dependent methyltransferase